MKNTIRFVLITAIGALSQFANLTAEVPGMIHYQGSIMVNGEPFSGDGLFKFALVDKAGTNTFWSHDNNSIGGAAPTTEIHVPVTDGIYSILLGDRDVPGMTRRIPTSVFENNTDVFLRVWFNDGTNGSLQLLPDARIASVGFAMVAAKVVDGSVSGAALQPNITLGGEASGTLTLKSGADQTRAILDAGFQLGIGSSLSLFDNTGSFQTARLVGSELGSAGAQLLLRNGAGNTTLEFDAQDGASTNSGGALRFKKDDGKNVLALEADIDKGNSGVLLYDSTGTQETVRITGALSGNLGGFLSLKDETGTPTIQLSAQQSDPVDALGGVLKLADGNGRTTVELLAKETVDGQIARPGAALRLANSEAKFTAELTAGDFVQAGKLTLRDSDLKEMVELDAYQDGMLELANGNGDKTVLLKGNGGENQGELILRNSAQNDRVKLDADGANNGGDIQVFNAESELTVYVRGARNLTGGSIIELFKGNGGNPTITLDSDNNGEGKITTQVLQITGGSDLSEQFNIQPSPASSAHRLVTPEPGMIVCIDSKRPGELRLSDRAFDSAVAGIISGAGGVKPGMLMGQHGSLADGRHPVALTGRVYCWIDASYGAVQPGDIITTSETPGHGMRATPAQAQGAIIGKAMTALPEGRGLVMVLVSLQ